MGKVVLWGCGDGFRRILEIFPCLPNYVDLFVDKKPCLIEDIEVQQPTILTSCKVDSLIICSYKYEDAIRKDAIMEYHVASDKIFSLNHWIICQMKTQKDFLLRPTEVAIDASTLCQLNCRDCYMRHNDNGTMGYGYLRLHSFRDVLERHPFIKHVELANSGEVFLNPDLQWIIRTAAKKGVSLSMGNGTNFNDVSEDVLFEMVKTQAVKNITIAIDGVTQHTYEIYRRKGNLNRVIENIRKVNILKKEYNSVFPILNWSYIIFPHNEDDVETAKEKAHELGMGISFKLAWETDTSWKPKNAKRLKQLTGLDVFSREEYQIQNKRNYKIDVCKQMIYTPYFNWDGRMLGCCWVYTSDWNSNLFDANLVDIVNHVLYRDAICMFLGGRIINNNCGIPCSTCGMRNEYLTGNAIQLF